MIRLERVAKTYDGGRTFAVREVSLEIAAGEFASLLGPSGCGKTTTLKTINRLVEPSSGRVEVDGRDTAEADPVALRRGIGYVFQGVGLFPHLSIAENVATVPRLLGWSESEVAGRVDELLDLVGLPPAEFRERRPAQLSGGQRQRVGVARALAARPRIVLLDEPFGALDPITRDDLQRSYRSLHERLGLTTVLVTHDMSEALLLADRIVVMKDGEIVQTGTPRELLRAPATAEVEALLATPTRQASRIESLLRDPDR